MVKQPLGGDTGDVIPGPTGMWLEPRGQDKEITLTVAVGLELTGVNLNIRISVGVGDL